MALVKGQRFRKKTVSGIVEIVSDDEYIFHDNGTSRLYPLDQLEQRLHSNEWILCESSQVLSILQHYPE